MPTGRTWRRTCQTSPVLFPNSDSTRWAGYPSKRRFCSLPPPPPPHALPGRLSNGGQCRRAAVILRKHAQPTLVHRPNSAGRQRCGISVSLSTSFWYPGGFSAPQERGFSRPSRAVCDHSGSAWEAWPLLTRPAWPPTCRTDTSDSRAIPCSGPSAPY